MSQNMGGHSPTNKARRSALPRASWSTVFARIHRPMQRPPPPPSGALLDDTQLSDAGVGPLFHRRYQARIAEPKLSAEELMERITADPDQVAPKEFARFKKVHGQSDAADGTPRGADEVAVRSAASLDG